MYLLVGTAVQDEMDADVRTPRGLPTFASGELLRILGKIELHSDKRYVRICKKRIKRFIFFSSCVTYIYYC